MRSTRNGQGAGSGSGGSATFVGARAIHAAQSITNSTITTLAATTEEFDSDGFHDNATNNSRLTIPTGKAGKYLVGYLVVWATTSATERWTQLVKNGATNVLGDVRNGSGNNQTAQGGAGLFDLAEADYFQVQVYHLHGSAINASGAMWAVKVG